MSTATQPFQDDKPIENLRIRFWGVQGSCPMFPEPHEVEEYRWMVAGDAIQRVLRDLRQTSRTGAASLDQLLAIANDDAELIAYLRSLGKSELPVYGGETTCISVETAEGNVLMLDGGSGIRNASKHLIDNWGGRNRVLYLLASHGHLDHRSGLPFSQFCFARPPFDMQIYGTRSFLGALDQGYGIFSRTITKQMYYDDPIDYRIMSAKFHGVEIPNRDEPADPTETHPWNVHGVDAPIQIGSTTITPFDVYHGPTRCLAYKIQHGGKTFVFCTDHELRHGPDPADPRQQKSLAAEARLVEICQDADVAYFDGQYFLEEYFGRKRIGLTAAVPRMDWGHGCIEDVIARCRQCRIKHAVIGHHDPERSWQERFRMDHDLAEESKRGACRIELGKSDVMIDLSRMAGDRMALNQEKIHIVRPLGQYLDCPTPMIEAALAWQQEAAKRHPPVHRRLGALLFDGGHLSVDQLNAALHAQRLDRLANCPLFPGFTTDELSRLAPVAHEVSVAQGEVFIHRDSIGDCLFVIASGSVQVFGHYEGSEESTLAMLGPGESIGEMGYFTGGQRTASARAMQATQLLCVSYGDLEECFRVVPNLAGGFLQIITHRLRELNQQYSASTHRARLSEQSLKHLSEYLDLSDHLSLGTGIEALIDRVVTTASKLLRAERASLFLVDPVRDELWSKVAQGVQSREIRVQMGHGLVGWVAEHGETLNIKDAYEDERFKRDTDQRTGYRTRTVLCGPVRNLQGEIIGVIQVINKNEGVFHELDEQLFKAFAHQAAIAVENFNLYRRLIGSHEKMTIMLDVATALTDTLELPALIRKIVAKVTQIVQCDRSAFFVLDRETEELWSMEAHGSSLEEIRFPVSAGLAGHTARTGEVLNIADAYEDARFNQAFDQATGYRTRSVLCVPTLDREGKVMGVTQAINKLGGERFGDEDAAMLKAVSSQIGVAVENAQLYARTVSMKNYLQSVQESISNSILTLDEDYRIVTANKAALRLLDAVPAQCLKRDLRDVLGTTNQYLLGLIDEVYAGSKGAAALDMELSGGERTSTVNASVLPLNGPDDARQGLVVVMEDITREKRVKSLLVKKMAKDVVERLLSDPQMQKLGGQRGVATILFCDIRGFTTISEGISAEQTVELLNGYFTRMVEVVQGHGGVLDKFMGDAFMALYGVPFPEADDAVRAVRSALNMQRALTAFNTGRRAQGLPPIAVGVGVNSGEVVYGNIGSESRSDFTVIGDAVNLASRVEGLNKIYESQILVTEFTRAQLGDHFALRAVDHVRVKGKHERTEIFEVLGDRDYRQTAEQASFCAGLEAYRRRDFKGAAGHFRRGQAGDPLCRVFASRCEELMGTPPAGDWDGVWHLQSK